ncbi:hypothetical protein MADA3029_740043 [Vibrio nigripulchritudo MADA3029]|nr:MULTISPECIES: hypothetical protein [Vibrio]CCN45998.1 hypothetical protein VIBNIMADA3020_1180028 [Vibrio nigripulchritudo MADA3020]CCN54122.1 hypothetical protein VIBNIMADA3021_510045 [Vibrio nigripulchritudo MADA3021]CCN61192.1 hypothetical protein MADA3029_740043 [Vibrio nigripulchritudo MADA3029]
MSKVRYKLPIYLKINGRKVCCLVDYDKVMQFRNHGLTDEEIAEKLIKAA